MSIPNDLITHYFQRAIVFSLSISLQIMWVLLDERCADTFLQPHVHLLNIHLHRRGHTNLARPNSTWGDPFEWLLNSESQRFTPHPGYCRLLLAHVWMSCYVTYLLKPIHAYDPIFLTLDFSWNCYKIQAPIWLSECNFIFIRSLSLSVRARSAPLNGE